MGRAGKETRKDSLRFEIPGRDLALAIVIGAAAAGLICVGLWITSGLPLHIFIGTKSAAAILLGESPLNRERLCPMPKTILPEPGGDADSAPSQDALQPVAHPANPVRLHHTQVRKILLGEIVDWSEVGALRNSRIEIYTADGKTLSRLGLMGPQVMEMSGWKEVMERVQKRPNSMALLPQKWVDYRVRTIAEPLDPATGNPASSPKTERIVFVGDILLSNWMEILIRLKTIVADDGLYPFGSTAPILRAADLSVGNLECPIVSGEKSPPLTIQFAGDPGSLRRLAAAGFDLMSIANNHILNKGRLGLSQTMEHLENHSIDFIGAGKDFKSAYSPRVVELDNGTRVAWLGFNSIGRETRQGQSGPVVASGKLPGHEALCAVRRARSMADLVVVFMHWGIELQNMPSPTQRKLGHKLVDAGADLVVGAHPHCVQGIEFYKEALIVYSLGNFVFAANEISDRLAATTGGAMLQCQILDSRIYQFEIIPILEVLGEPVPLSADCPDPRLKEVYRDTLRKIYKNSVF